ncbi:MAG: type II secretion system protein [Chloroflexi bacterium]|nr:type II secretion system protein [Chloroflexota bacterium]
MGNQRGFTLLELVVGLAVAGMVMPLIASSIFQITRGTEQISGRVVSAADVASLAPWLHRDLAVGQTIVDPATDAPLIDCASGTQASILVRWTDQTGWGAADPQHYAKYSIEPGTTVLEREYDGVVGVVARHITELAFCEDADGLVRLDVTSEIQGTTTYTKSLSFYVAPRAEVAP